MAKKTVKAGMNTSRDGLVDMGTVPGTVKTLVRRMHETANRGIANRKKSRKLYRTWSEAETRALAAGVAEHGVGQWAKIKRDAKYASTLSMRSNVDLKDKWRTAKTGPSPRKPRSPSLGRGPVSPVGASSPTAAARAAEYSRLSPTAKQVLNELRASGQVPAHAEHLSPSPIRMSVPNAAEYDDDEGFEDYRYGSPEPTTDAVDDRSNCSMM